MAFLERRRNSRGETIWVIHYRIGTKQKMKTIGKTDKRTAQQYLIRFESQQLNNGIGVKEFKKISLNDYQKEFLELTEKEKSPRTVQREKQIIEAFIGYFGDVCLSDISIIELEEYRLHRLKSNRLTEETINLEFRHLKAMFNRAKKYGYIRENPFNSIKPMRVTEPDLPRFFELEEIAEVREAFKGDSFEDLVNFYLLTGARLREPLSLTWENVDFRRKQLRIRSAHTKNKKHRMISFQDDKQLEELLLRLPRREDNLLFGPANDQKQWGYLWVSKRISKILNKIGFSWASCHTFRHTYISHLVMQGVPLSTVKEIVGHSDIKTTERYAHLAPKHTKEMLARRPY